MAIAQVPDFDDAHWSAPSLDENEPANDDDAPSVSGISELRGPSIDLIDGPRLAEELPPIEYLIPEIGLVAGGGAPHQTAGYGFAGKTLAWQSALLSLAAGRRVWGAYGSTTSRRVVHVDLEQGERLTRRRYQRLARATDLDLASVGDSLVVAVMPPIALSNAYADSWERLMVGRDLILIDSLRAASGGEDENASNIRAGLDMLGHLSEKTGCRPLVIHHARKPTADDPGARYSIRGSSAIYDACDSIHVFSAAKGEPILVEHVKARSHGEPTESFALVISDVEIAGDPRAGVRVAVHGAELVTQKREAQEASARQAKAQRDSESVKAAVAATPGIGVQDLRAHTGFGGSRLAAAIAAAGSAVERREERDGRTRRVGHYLRGAT